MPVHEQESAFIKRFIAKPKQDRYLYLLSRPDLRGKFLAELCHRLAIKDSLATELPSRKCKPAEVERRLRSLGAGSLAYVISPDRRFDGQWLELTGVLSEILSSDTEAIVCCLPGQLAFFHSEDSAYILNYPPVKPVS